MDKDFLYNFMLQAIVIIYPDGTIDSETIDVNNFTHLYYFSKLLEKSPSFKNICSDCNFDDYHCLSIKKRLYDNDCVVFLNFNITEIAARIMFDIPEFQVLIPTSFKSLEQVNNFRSIVDNYSQKYLMLYTYKEGKIIDLPKEDINTMLDEFQSTRKM